MFASLPVCEETKKMKSRISETMFDRYEDYIRSGMSEQQAYKEVVQQFGDIREIQKSISIAGISNAYMEFKGRYPTFMVLGFLGIAIVPLLIFTTMLSIGADWLAWSLFFVSFIPFVVLIISVEMQNHKYQLLLYTPEEKRLSILRNIISLFAVGLILISFAIFKNILVSMAVVPIAAGCYYLIRYFQLR